MGYSTEFWKKDNLRNIIPKNQKLGEFPEGWDVRPYLNQLLKPYTSIVEIGCGYGRLCQAFDSEYYLGLDINPEAVIKASQKYPSYNFDETGYLGPYPKTDALLAYTVLLHCDDDTIGKLIENVCSSAEIVLVAEILGRKWRRKGNPPVFNREKEEYVDLFSKCGFSLITEERQPYEHYKDTYISFLLFGSD